MTVVAICRLHGETQFYKHPSGKRCKICKNIVAKAWNRKNRAKVNLGNRLSYKRNRTKILARQKVWNKENIDKIRIRKRIYNEKHREHRNLLWSKARYKRIYGEDAEIKQLMNRIEKEIRK